MKVFNTFDSVTVSNCQHFCGYLPLEHVARVRKVNFLVNMGLHENSVIRTVHSLSIDDELKPIANFYQVDVNQLAFKCRVLARNCVICKIGLDTPVMISLIGMFFFFFFFGLHV